MKALIPSACKSEYENDKNDHTELPGEIKPVTNYGGLSEALADTGTEIKKTLSEIQTVADALPSRHARSTITSGAASDLLTAAALNWTGRPERKTGTL